MPREPAARNVSHVVSQVSAAFFSPGAWASFVSHAGAQLNDRLRNWFPLKDLKLILAGITERAMFSGFIFDVEGTLVDSVSQNLKSQQEALERFGHQVPYSTLQLYSGLDGDQTLQLVLPEAKKPRNGKRFLKAKGEIYEAKYLDEVRPFDGIRDVFRVLVERGGKIALATDCKGPELKRYLSLLQVDEFVSATACGDDVEHGKPDPRLVGLAVKTRASRIPVRDDWRHAIRCGGGPWSRSGSCGRADGWICP